MPRDDQTRASKLTITIPAELGEQLDRAQVRLAAELRARLSMNQVAARFLRLGLEAERT